MPSSASRRSTLCAMATPSEGSAEGSAACSRAASRRRRSLAATSGRLQAGQPQRKPYLGDPKG